VNDIFEKLTITFFCRTFLQRL